MAKLNDVSETELEAYKAAILKDFQNNTPGREFIVGHDVGSSYIRVWTQYGGRDGRSSHSFIVNKAGKFPVGTILKCATWKAPALNFARGTLQNFGNVRWTGW